MADLLATTIAEVKWYYTANNQQCINVFHYRLGVQVNNVNPIDVTDGLLTVLSNSGAGSMIEKASKLQGTNVIWQKASVQLIFPERWTIRENEVAQGGLAAVTCTAQNVQAVILKRGMAASRHTRGAMHLGGLAADQYSAGLLTAPALVLLQDLADALMFPIGDGVTGFNWDPVILNKEEIPNTDPKKFRITGATDMWQTVALQPLRVMNRRTVGRGI